jgi:predicted small integral membrane protein
VAGDSEPSGAPCVLLDNYRLGSRGDGAAGAAAFNHAKALAALGLTVSLLQWFVAFIAVGGEWFLMWQSQIWNGQDAAFRMFACIGVVMLILIQKDED